MNNMERDKPYFVEKSKTFFLYCDVVKSLSGNPKIIGQYSSEEVMQEASKRLLGESAERKF